MAKKNALPKKIAGMKVPKAVRKSSMLRALLRSEVGRDILANAITAGAGAAAAVLVAERKEIGKAGKKGIRKGAGLFSLATEAVQSAANAALGVVAETAGTFASGKKKGKGGAGRAAAH
ncbi:hypothetical protein [Mesorhizobium sp. IMUNJ 23232]|uniref:hypothetical protein n=1 Tax=Mesorhizobium sp. IMUNJ 23232 TaxID=3376064 RepID=UPI0037B86B55